MGTSHFRTVEKIGAGSIGVLYKTFDAVDQHHILTESPSI
jgi:hypothetical protein